MNKTIKIEFIPDKEAEVMLKKNCAYRHFLYNKCVEIVKQYQDNDPNGYIGNFSMYGLLSIIRDLYETNILDYDRPEWLEDYDYYFRGISECVIDDISNCIQKVVTKRSDLKRSDIHFMKYNPNKMSFRFKNKIHRERKPNHDGMYQGNSIILTDNPYVIGVKINNTMGYPLGIHLRESVNKFHIDFNEVREIAFKFHNEKWYICLIMRDYHDYTELIQIHYERKEVAGIDLGETNPVVIYDGKKVEIPRALQYPKIRINKVETRIKRLQSVLDRKYNTNEDKFHQSNNYYKVLRKFHKAWEHLVNIKKDWHFKLAYWIVTHYKNIVVDEFDNYIVNIDSGYPTKLRKSANHSMFNKSMFIFTQRLIHMCIKYGTNYFKPLDHLKTTNTCSSCGNVNIRSLLIDERIFRCECCEYVEDRDVNASINCYNAYYDNLIM